MVAFIPDAMAALRSWVALDRDARYLTLARVLQTGNGFLLSILLVREFGLAAAGTYAIAGVAIGGLAILGHFGLPYSLAIGHAPMAERNALGCTAGMVVLPLALPVIAAFAVLVGKDFDEALIIGAFSLNGVFFAQIAIFNALLVLQSRARLAVLPQAFGTLTLVAAAVFAGTLTEFAAIIGVARLAGLGMCFALPHHRLSLKAFIAHARTSCRFQPFEVLQIGADQIFTVLLSFVLTREAMGVWGLWRQLFNFGQVAPTAMVQSVYPEIAQRPKSMMLQLRSRTVRMGTIWTIIILLLAVPLGLYVYNAPSLPVFALWLTPCLPLGCLIVLHDMGLRPLGDVGRMNRLALLKGAVLCSVVPVLAAFGMWGLALGYTAYTAFSAAVTMRLFARLCARRADDRPEGAAEQKTPAVHHGDGGRYPGEAVSSTLAGRSALLRPPLRARARS